MERNNKLLSLGLKVQALRKTQNLTQEDLAEITGVSWRTISNLETGRTVPKLELIYDLSQFFNIGMDELLNNRIQTSKTTSRLKLENQIIADLQSLNDNMLYHLKEYILLLKKDFD
ncbi:MAG: helix-turn-helix transcriptional regulator [Alphaproteobacteria bacterium]|nr:helix-turn-helix transcriptional regulator [Alphaproteobacteria bacterium]